jgi:hypothetical protein
LWNTVRLAWNHVLYRKPNNKPDGQQQTVHQFGQHGAVKGRMNLVSFNPSLLHLKKGNHEEVVEECYLDHFCHECEVQKDVALEMKT